MNSWHEMGQMDGRTRFVYHLDTQEIPLITTARKNRRTQAKKRNGDQKSATPFVARKSTVSRWGNSLGLRIPQEGVDELGLKAGGHVLVEVRPGLIIIRRARKKWTEAELLNGVTLAMVGGEIDWGPAVGKEVW